MWKEVLIVALGGGTGSALRYVVSLGMLKCFGGQFPFGTLVVNVVGCFLAGVLFNVVGGNHATLRLLLLVGFCGGFTTFSAFAVESVALWQAAAYLKIMLYAALSVLLGLAAALAGMALVK